MGKLFGTDGIRGRAGDFPLDNDTVAIIGASLARHFREQLGRTPVFVTGRDSRESGSWIETALHSGVAAENGVVSSAGVITTPGVAYLTGADAFDAGIVISASHNPFEDNGIKVFLPSGKKIDDSIETSIEKDIEAGESIAANARVETANAARFASEYLDHLADAVDGTDLSGIKVVLDCANGAASAFAPSLFARLGMVVTTINDQPNGRNINLNCGSLHIDELQAKVIEAGADIGVAFDGDADRALFVDENGVFVDGDATMWVMAQYLLAHGKLANSTVVATVMSNIGLELALGGKGIKLLRTNVGDKYVLDELIKTGSEIGGEQSGHIIFPERSLVGDGMMTALLLVRAMKERGVSLSQAVGGFVRYPQILVNVKVAEKRPFDDVPAIADAAAELARQLDGNGRLLLRYSGTENLARVMIEGEDQANVETQARQLAAVIETALG